MSAVDMLADALDRLEDSGSSWPCRSRAEWISDHYEDREYAAAHCTRCPVLQLCAAAADEIRANAGVWGGIPRGTAAKAGRPHRSTTEQKAS